MLVVRFIVRCLPQRTEEMAAAMVAVADASRDLPGVHHFNVTRDLNDPNVLMAIEVFEDREAMTRQEEQPAVAGVVELLQGGALAEPPQWTIYEVAHAETPTLS
jgi:quinol monooxygenase YgiN